MRERRERLTLLAAWCGVVAIGLGWAWAALAVAAFSGPGAGAWASWETAAVADEADADAPEYAQSVIVTLNFDDDGAGAEATTWGLFDLEDALAAALAGTDLGDVDGNGIGRDSGDIFLNTNDADRLYAAIEPVLKQRGLPRGSHVVLLYGLEKESRVATIEY